MLTANLKQAVARAEFAERSVQKLQKEVSLVVYWNIVTYIDMIKVDRLEDELMEELDKYKSVSEELEQAFAEMSG